MALTIQPYRTLRRTVGLACAVPFCAFTFALVYCIKGELLAYAQHVYAHGLTHYNALPAAIVITLLLQALQAVVAFVSRINLRILALTYLPSCLALVMLTNITPSVIQHFHFGIWTWLAPLLLLIYALLAFLGNQLIHPVRHARHTEQFLLTNYLILFPLIALTATIDLTSDTFLYELKQERLIRQHRYAEATRVGEKCLQPTPRMLQLRAYALARSGQLPERLFDMPQTAGGDGLLNVADTCESLRRIDNTYICQTLGAQCRYVSSTDKYLQLLNSLLLQQHDSLSEAITQVTDNDSIQRNIQHALYRNITRRRLTCDYIILRNILDRQLDSLPTMLARRDSLYRHSGPQPRAYAQALCLVDTLLTDTATLRQYHEYQQLKYSLDHPTERRNRTRRKFGNTYWWYYDNP